MKKPTALSAADQALRAAFEVAYERELSQSSHGATPQAALHAAAIACRETLARRWAATQAADAQRGDKAPVRRVHYLSMEFL
ncbi:hypothetical protein, partial [Klebsiella pneumoniae]